MQKRHYCYMLVGIGLFILGGMMSSGPREALAAIGFTPVRDVDVAARKPFRINLGPGSGVANKYQVPAGKRLVIEFISFTARFPQGAVANFLLWEWHPELFGYTNYYYFPTTYQGTDSLGVDNYVGAQMTRLYYEPGTEVRIPVTDYSCAISGYLEPVP